MKVCDNSRFAPLIFVWPFGLYYNFTKRLTEKVGVSMKNVEFGYKEGQINFVQLYTELYKITLAFVLYFHIINMCFYIGIKCFVYTY